jgi:hypothetical protein
MATFTLDWLDFDYSEDAQGHGSFDAMASVTAAELPALQQELARVLDWAHREFAGLRAPLDDGGDWDFELQGLQEVPAPLDVRWDEGAGRLELRPGAPGAPRITLSLTLTGTPAFCDAFRRAFALEG